VISVFRTPTRRIALAIVLSMLIHVAILWLPYIQLPQADVQLPPLSVRLESPPKPVENPADKTLLANPEPGNPLNQTGASAIPETSAMAEMNRTEVTTVVQPFPKHLQLRFIVFTNGSRIGEILQQLDIHGDRYNLTSIRNTSGLASLRNSDRLIQTSQGKIGKHGLQPDMYEQEIITKGGKHSLRATFDRKVQKLRYLNGNVDALSADAQDSLSFIYQLSQLPMHGEFFPLPVSNGTQLLQYQIEIGSKMNIDTPLGNLHTLHLRKMHKYGEPYFEIWLGLEYRLLPVRFSEYDSSGNVTEEFDISSIRASDE